jgi:GT2 family glycosyltransferase
VLKKVRIVTATARNQVEFWHLTLLGQSLGLFPRQDNLTLSIFHQNIGGRRRGLGALYNTFLDARYSDEIILFVHDDVYLHDWHLVHRLNEATASYDVVGLAGNTSPDFDEPSWMLAWDLGKHPGGRQPLRFLSGTVGHLVRGRTQVSHYGDSPRECGLLDGLFLAVNTKKILEHGIRFDQQFHFHFYDLDFCRQCLKQGLRLGTWPIAATHGSGGGFGSQEWLSAREAYRAKWGTDGIPSPSLTERA